MKKTVFSAISLLSFAGAVGAQTIPVEVPKVEPPRSTLTRAEVTADLHIWRLAGLQDLTHGEHSPDIESYEYRRAYATYVQLRSSPQFDALVARLMQTPNASVVATRQIDAAVQARN